MLVIITLPKGSEIKSYKITTNVIRTDVLVMTYIHHKTCTNYYCNEEQPSAVNYLRK
jgi:hypothetical protein